MNDASRNHEFNNAGGAAHEVIQHLQCVDNIALRIDSEVLTLDEWRQEIRGFAGGSCIDLMELVGATAQNNSSYYRIFDENQGYIQTQEWVDSTGIDCPGNTEGVTLAIQQLENGLVNLQGLMTVNRPNCTSIQPDMEEMNGLVGNQAAILYWGRPDDNAVSGALYHTSLYDTTILIMDTQEVQQPHTEKNPDAAPRAADFNHLIETYHYLGAKVGVRDEAVRILAGTTKNNKLSIDSKHNVERSDNMKHKELILNLVKKKNWSMTNKYGKIDADQQKQLKEYIDSNNITNCDNFKYELTTLSLSSTYEEGVRSGVIDLLSVSGYKFVPRAPYEKVPTNVTSDQRELSDNVVFESGNDDMI